MTPSRRSRILAVSVMGLLAACTTVSQPVVPAAQSPSAPTAAPAPPAPAMAVPSTVPTAMPVPSANPAMPGTTPLHVSLVFPAGAFLKVQSGLRTLAAVPDTDLSPADLQRFSVAFQGHDLPPGQISVGGAAYDEAHNLVVSMELMGIDGPGVLRVATPHDRLVLLKVLGTTGGGAATVDVGSTADALVDQALTGLPAATDADRQSLAAIVRRKVTGLFNSSRTGNVESDGDVQSTLRRLATAVESGTVLDPAALGLIENPRTSGGGGGVTAATPAAPVVLAGSVSTFAGDGNAAFADNATPTSARFSGPGDIVVDHAGANLYVADTTNNRIRKIVLATGAVSTLAGDGLANYADNATGTSAEFSLPTGLAIDSTDSTLYVADWGNSRIRKIDLTAALHPVSTLAGDGNPGFADNATGTSARFNTPYGLAVDSTGNNLYVADKDNHRIRKIDLTAALHPVTTLAGNGNVVSQDDATGTSAQIGSPKGLVIDPTGSAIYVAAEGNNQIRKIDLSAALHPVTTVAGEGTGAFADNATGTAAKFNSPSAITIDPTGSFLYVADSTNHRIRKIDLTAALHPVTTLAGDGNAAYADNAVGTSARFNTPRGVAFNRGGTILYVSDTVNNRIRKIQ